MISVLYIDDDNKELLLVKQFLENDREIHVESATTVAEALSCLKKSSFDVVVSEFLLPETDGVSSLKKIRSETALPVILYTGKSSEELAIGAINNGVTGYIRKGDLTASRFSVLLWKIREAANQHKKALLLTENEAKYHELIENANIIILKTDKDSRVTFFNGYAQKFFGFSEPEMLGQPLTGTIIPTTVSDTFPDMDYFVRDSAIQ